MTLHPRLPGIAKTDLAVGRTIHSPFRSMTRERMRWYVDAQETAVKSDGKPHFGGPTIHDDDEYALKQGLPGIIADGMVSTNWLLALMTDIFGPQFAQKGRLRTKYIAPVYEDMQLRSCALITTLETQPDGLLCKMDIWCETPEGQKVTIGEAHTLITE
ncbi:MaoC family dehydratase [Roseibium limicola]|uniref:MaoC-like domain-containing protein n=1 Tax=Roseibium limicola TaxID=2816037 RepID=A0A939EKG1_9HYPH|nr:MaoC/PaaZ C-terminal domain-containing protein [Roseibium limicola]MBO0344246.1 hypothetical protein [Roseibium limicola]